MRTEAKILKAYSEALVEISNMVSIHSALGRNFCIYYCNRNLTVKEQRRFIRVMRRLGLRCSVAKKEPLQFLIEW